MGPAAGVKAGVEVAERLGLGRERPRERDEPGVDVGPLDLLAPAAEGRREVGDGPDDGEAAVAEVVGRPGLRVGLEADERDAEPEQEPERAAEPQREREDRRRRLARGLDVAEDLGEPELGRLRQLGPVALGAELLERGLARGPLALELAELDLLPGDGPELAARLGEPARERRRAGLGPGEVGLDGRDLALELGHVALPVGPVAAQVEPARAHGRVRRRRDAGAAVGPEAAEPRVDGGHVGVAGGVAAELGVLRVDLLEEPLQPGDLGVEVRRLDGRRRVGAPREPLGDRREVGPELAEPGPLRLRLDAGEVELALELADLAHGHARLLVEPGRVLVGHEPLELGLDLVELALAPGDLLVEHLARPRRPLARRRLRERLVRLGVEPGDERGLLGAAGLGLELDGVGLLGRRPDRHDLLLEVLGEGVGRDGPAVAGRGPLDGREAAGLALAEERLGRLERDLGRLLEHEPLVDHLRHALARRRGHGARAGVAGLVRDDEEDAVGRVRRRREEPVGGARDQPQQREAEDDGPVPPEQAERPAERPAGLVARRGRRRRRGGRRRGRAARAGGRGRARRRGQRGRRRVVLVEGDAEAVLVVVHAVGADRGVPERVAELDGRVRGRRRGGVERDRAGRRRDRVPRRQARRRGAVARHGGVEHRDVLEHGVLDRGVRAAERRLGAGGRGAVGHEGVGVPERTGRVGSGPAHVQARLPMPLPTPPPAPIGTASRQRPALKPRGDGSETRLRRAPGTLTRRACSRRTSRTGTPRGRRGGKRRGRPRAPRTWPSARGATTAEGGSWSGARRRPGSGSPA